jgi:hypothetical protein
MGTFRNGARSLLTLMAKCCHLTRLPGFQTGIRGILGTENGDSFLSLWLPLCNLIDTLIAADNFFNKKDATDEGETEDGVPVG